MENPYEKMSDEELWLFYADTEQELKNRNLVRTRNTVGERGEFLVIRTYKETKGLPNLQAAPEGTQNVDALSRKGERYSIKTVTEPSKTTGVFYGCGEIGDDFLPEKKFEYAVIVVLQRDYRLKGMYEISWEQFLNYRKWHSTMRAWNLSLTKLLKSGAKIIYER